MQFVWFTWKDNLHPDAGGAELVSSNICKRLAADGHEVLVITSQPEGYKKVELIDGYKVLRGGNRFSVYWHAYKAYRRLQLSDNAVIVEEVNTIPFFTRLYARKRHKFMLFHQLAREVWFYQFPMPFSIIGWALEPLYLRIARLHNVITVSESTRQDLIRNGYRSSTISIISEGLPLTPRTSVASIQKLPHPSLLLYGSVRPMKRTMHGIQAFERVKHHIPELRLTIAGSTNSNYGKKVIEHCKNSPYSSDITFTGRVNDEDLPGVLSRHHFILSTALKEGWGLTITEAAGQGTPAIAYNIDGQRDAVDHGKAGILIDPNVDALSEAIIAQFDAPDDNYNQLQQRAHTYASGISYQRSYADFMSRVLVATARH